MFYIAQKNWDKILGYAEEAYDTEKSEIGGMSVMVEDNNGDWELQHPVILKQEISSGNTVLEKDALAEYYTRQAKKMGKRNFRFCWWHSHHTMAAFWSSTDKEAIDEFDEGDFSFALVVNLKGEYKFRVSVWSPVQVHEDVELEVTGPGRVSKKMKKEVEDLCSKPSYTSNRKKDKSKGQTYSYTYGGYRSKDQMGVVQDPNQEMIPFRSSYTLKKTFSDITQEVDDIMTGVIDGTIDYKTYSISITELNTELAAEDSLYEVEIIAENKVNEMLYMLPSQLVKYREGDKDDDLAALNDMYQLGY